MWDLIGLKICGQTWHNDRSGRQQQSDLFEAYRSDFVGRPVRSELQ